MTPHPAAEQEPLKLKTRADFFSSEEFCGLKNSEEFSVGYSLVKRGLDTFYLLTNKEALIVQVGIYLR